MQRNKSVEDKLEAVLYYTKNFLTILSATGGIIPTLDVQLQFIPEKLRDRFLEGLQLVAEYQPDEPTKEYVLKRPILMTDEQIERLGGPSCLTVDIQAEDKEICSKCLRFLRVNVCDECLCFVCNSEQCYNASSGLCIDCKE